MCTVNIKIDNDKVRRINPNLKNNENIERWVQYCMDEFIDTLSSNGHTAVCDVCPECGGGRDYAKGTGDRHLSQS